MIETATGVFVGFCGVVRPPENDYDEIIYAFNRPAWGKGYATELVLAMLNYVFSISALDEIFATINPANAASQRVMDKINMPLIADERNDDGTTTKVYRIRRSEVG